MESNLTSLHSKYVVLCAIHLTYQLDLKTENYTQLCREIEMMNTQNGVNVLPKYLIIVASVSIVNSISMSLVFTVKFQAKQANGVKIDF
ncbi:hypothetical protein T12_4955 [Trichinella patagoniensis]|uniref:Uncharacterized protein n=1 Tax=Trichinella patagoniensis TaxID=990121 RepID=A0A0V1A8U7_9BILA|nr:hypothetical protein T12_4955 [Trichinella patagoniensis]